MMWQDDEIHRNGEELDSSLSASQLTSMAGKRSSIGNQNGRGRRESGRIGSLIASTFSNIQNSLREETAAVATGTSDKEGQVDDNNNFMGQKWKEAEDYNRGKRGRERLAARSMSMSHASTVVVAKADEWASPPHHLHQSDQEMQQQQQQFVHKSYSHAVLRESSRSQRRRRSTIQHITLPSIEAPDGVEGREYEVDTAGGPRDAGSSSTASWKARGLHRRSSSGGVDKWHRNNSMNLMNLKSANHDEIEVGGSGSYTYHNSSLTSSASPNASDRRGWGMPVGGGGSSGGTCTATRTCSGAGSSTLRPSGSFGDMTDELSRRWEATQNSLDDEIHNTQGLELGDVKPGESTVKKHHQPRRGKRPVAARRNSMF